MRGIRLQVSGLARDSSSLKRAALSYLGSYAIG
jgi:hypothetical protein